MKKILVLLVLCSILFSCGKPKYKIYTQQEKEKIMNQMNKNDLTLTNEWKKNMKNINTALSKGDTTAKNEKEEWTYLIEDLSFYSRLNIEDLEVYELLEIEKPKKVEVRGNSEGASAGVDRGFKE